MTSGGVQVPVLAEAGDADIQELYAALRALPAADSVLYVTKEKALEMKRMSDPELAGFLETYDLKNPFMDVFLVTLDAPEGYAALRSFLEENRWKSVVSQTFFTSVHDEEMRVNGLLRVTRGVASLLIALLVASLAVLVAFLAAESWRNRYSIELMSLLGADRKDAVLLFAFRTTLVLLASLAAGAVALGLAYAVLPVLTAPAAYGLTGSFDGDFRSFLLFAVPAVLLAELLLAPVLAYGGAWLGARRHDGRKR